MCNVFAVTGWSRNKQFNSVSLCMCSTFVITGWSQTKQLNKVLHLIAYTASLQSQVDHRTSSWTMSYVCVHAQHLCNHLLIIYLAVKWCVCVHVQRLCSHSLIIYLAVKWCVCVHVQCLCSHSLIIYLAVKWCVCVHVQRLCSHSLIIYPTVKWCLVSVCVCSIFAIKPFTGLLSTQHQIFVVRITPEKVQTYKHKMTMRLNDNEKFDKVGGDTGETFSENSWCVCTAYICHMWFFLGRRFDYCTKDVIIIMHIIIALRTSLLLCTFFLSFEQWMSQWWMFKKSIWMYFPHTQPTWMTGYSVSSYKSLEM